LIALSGCLKSTENLEHNLNNSKGKITYLFVQNANSGTFIKSDNETYTLSLNDVSPQTIYFTDRPRKNVGQVEMQKFLDGLCFKSNDPPNAAIEILNGNKEEDVVIVELSDPVYNKTSKILKYTAKILNNINHSLSIYNERRDKSIPTSFNEVALFIDDCSDVKMQCHMDIEHLEQLCGTVTCCQCWSLTEGCDFQEDCCSWNRCKDQCISKYGQKCDRLTGVPIEE